jgi:TetR/AcrR family fatty acid metabolism transcriptional regulator
MSPRPDVSEERRKQIMDAALMVFSSKGLHQARMEDIAQQADLSKGTLYWYFNSKEEIISTLLTNFFDREFLMIEEWAVQEEPARKLLQNLASLIVSDLLSIKPFMSIFYEFWAMSFRNEKVGRVIRESMQQYLALIVPVVQRGIDRQEFRDLDATDVSMAFGALVEGAILLWSYDLNNVDLQAMINKSVTIFLDGIENQKRGVD